jgi:hypothetical protein
MSDDRKPQTTHVDRAMTKLAVRFPLRFDTDEHQKEWIRSNWVSLSGYDPDVLDRAAQRLIDTAKDRRFPMMSEIHKACATIIAEDVAAKRAAELPIDKHEGKMQYASYRRALAFDLIRSEMGRAAVREGWIACLVSFIEEHGRMPGEAIMSRATITKDVEGRIFRTRESGSEIDLMRRSGAGFDEAYADCVRGAQGPTWPAAAGRELGETMLLYREILADHVMGVIDLSQIRTDDEMRRRKEAKRREREALRKGASTDGARAGAR